MPRQLSLKTINARIAELQAKAKELENATKPGLKKVVALIKKHRLTLKDLEPAFNGKAPKVPKASKRRISKMKGRRVPVKYRDGQGNSWSGRGRLPRWLANVEKSGRDRSEFSVK